MIGISHVTDEKALEALNLALETITPMGLANVLNINNAHVYRSRAGDITLALKIAMVKQGLIPRAPKRHRLIAEMESGEQVKMMERYIKELGYESWTEYTRTMAHLIEMAKEETTLVERIERERIEESERADTQSN